MTATRKATLFTNFIIAISLFILPLVGEARNDAKTLPEPENETREKADKKGKQAQSTTITADSTEVDFRAGNAILTGNVVVKGPKMTVNADKMTVYFDQAEKQNRIKNIVAQKNVVIVQPAVNRTATAGKAVYDVPTGMITLTENPRLEMEDSTLENAESITYDRDSERVKSKGGSITFSSEGEGDGLNIFNRGNSDESE
ncbi:MAG: LptA/OstA family protein [Lentisphaeria bacterium]